MTQLSDLPTLAEQIEWVKRFKDFPQSTAEMSRAILVSLESLEAALARAQAAEGDRDNNFNEEFFALQAALRDWPKLPPAYVLELLNGTFPEDWERGKKIQRDLSSAVIPFKTECEIGAGMWDRITNSAWRTALSAQSDAKKEGE